MTIKRISYLIMSLNDVQPVSGQYWGEIEPPAEKEKSTVVGEKEQFTKLKTPVAQIKYLPLVQLDTVPIVDKNKTQTTLFNFGLGDDNLIHAIQLSNFLKSALNQGAGDFGQDVDVPQLVNCEPSNYDQVPNLRPESIQELIKRAVILMCVYSGYDVTTDSVLQILIDVCEAFIQRICQSLRAIVDTRELRTQKDISDNLGTLFNDVGIPLHSLHRFVQSIGTQKSNLVKEVTKKFGPVLEPSKQITPLEVSTMSAPLDLVVGLEESFATDNIQNNSMSWEKSLNVSE